MARQSAGRGASFDLYAGIAMRRDVRRVGHHQIGGVQELGGDRVERVGEVALVNTRPRDEASIPGSSDRARSKTGSRSTKATRAAVPR